MLDDRWIRSLHVASMRESDAHADREPHVLFQVGCDPHALLDYHHRELQSTTGLSAGEADCVVETLRRLPVPAQIRLVYDEDRYGRTIERCEV